MDWWKFWVSLVLCVGTMVWTMFPTTLVMINCGLFLVVLVVAAIWKIKQKLLPRCICPRSCPAYFCHECANRVATCPRHGGARPLPEARIARRR